MIAAAGLWCGRYPVPDRLTLPFVSVPLSGLCIEHVSKYATKEAIEADESEEDEEDEDDLSSADSYTDDEAPGMEL